jgi:hypothetical protein
MPLGFTFEGWDVADLAVKSGRVVPVDPFDCGVLGLLSRFPGSASVDQFSFVGAAECFSHCVVIRIADGSDRCGDVGVGETFGVAIASELAARIRVTRQSVRGVAPPDRHFDRIEYELGAQMRCDLSTNDRSRADIKTERHIHPAFPRGHVGDVCDPQLVRSLRNEPSIDWVW